MIANLVLAYGFLRHAQVPEGCCHTCEWCCMTECHEKYAATITAEPEALVQSKKFTAPDALMACLDTKVPKEDGKCAKWTPARAAATRACAKAAMQSPSSLIQQDPWPGMTISILWPTRTTSSTAARTR